jgi:hypothetical protein
LDELALEHGEDLAKRKLGFVLFDLEWAIRELAKQAIMG